MPEIGSSIRRQTGLGRERHRDLEETMFAVGQAFATRNVGAFGKADAGQRCQRAG